MGNKTVKPQDSVIEKKKKIKILTLGRNKEFQKFIISDEEKEFKNIFEGENFLNFIKENKIRKLNIDTKELKKINDTCFILNTSIDAKKKIYIIKTVDKAKNEKNILLFNNNLKTLKQFILSFEMKGSRYSHKFKGYFSDENKFYFVFNYYDYKFADVINCDLDFVNRIKILKILLELVKDIHLRGIISLSLHPDNLYFSKKFILKHRFQNSIHLASHYDINTFFICNINDKDIYTPPEIYLNNSSQVSWHSDIWSLGILISKVFNHELSIENDKLLKFYQEEKLPRTIYKYIDNLYIQSIVLGILKLSPSERPNVFQIIDNYNSFIDILISGSDKFNKDFYIINTKEEFLKFAQIFFLKPAITFLESELNN